MNKNLNNSGFSLMEMLLATGIMAIGLVMVATVFPVGVKLTTLTTERTIGAVAADEAFAKVQLYGLRDFQYWPVPDPNEACSDYQYVTDFVGPDGIPGTADDDSIHRGLDGIWGNSDDIFWNTDFQYPSSMTLDQQDRNYHWSALCRRVRVGAKDVQVTVFVNRRISTGAQFRAWDPSDGFTTSDWPKPIPVNVNYFSIEPKELVIQNGPAFQATESKYFFDDGYTIVDDRTGKIYRILEVDNRNGILKLQEEWQWEEYPLSPGNETDRTVWVVPPAVGSDRYPCVGVFQKVIRFDDIN